MQKVSTPVKALVVITYALMITTNALANALPINGRTTGGVSDAYGNLFAPAGLTFAIWGVIYLLLGAHVLYQLGVFRSDEPTSHPGLVGGAGIDLGDAARRDGMLQRVGVLFSLSSISNAAWILSWHYDLIALSTLLLATMLALLIGITREFQGTELSARDRLFVRLPFSVYFGWLTVATIANITVWLVSVGWDGLGIAEPVWAAIILAVGALIGATAVLRDKDIAYGFVLVWAYLGIWIKHTSAAGFDGAYPLVSATALVGIAIVVAAGAAVLMRRRVQY